MKKILFVAAVALLAFSSCNKDKNAPTANIEGEKIQMNLTATLEGGKVDGETSDAKRISYTENNGLKGTWDATETITVVSLDASGNSLHFDNFTSTGAAGRTTAEFTGTITADANTASYICWYPAINSKTFLTAELNSPYNNWSCGDNRQNGNNDFSHIASKVIMSGIPTIDGNNIDVTMQHALSVFKYEITLPNEIAEGTSVTSVDITATRGFNSFGSWSYIYSQSLNYGGSGATTFLNTTIDNYTVPADRKLTVYRLVRAISVQQNDEWTIAAKRNSTVVATKTITWNQNKTFESGKMYTFPLALNLPE